MPEEYWRCDNCGGSVPIGTDCCTGSPMPKDKLPWGVYNRMIPIEKGEPWPTEHEEIPCCLIPEPQARAGFDAAQILLEIEATFHLTIMDKAPSEAYHALDEAIQKLKEFIGERE